MVQSMKYYPETGNLKSVTAAGTQSFEYHYDVLGNMDHRYDHLHKVNGQSLHEQFYYDRRNQLTDTYLNGTLASHIIYDNLGNITSKSKTGGMEYQSGNSPYRLTGIVPDQNIDPGYKLSQNITYTDFNTVESITGNGYKLEIEYGLENQRIIQSLSSVNQYGLTTLLLNKHFIGGLQEKIFYETGAEKTISYITSPEGLTAIEVKSGTSSEWYTVFTDHLGSITTLIRESDGLKFELSYDAWGNRRNPATWVNYSGNLPDFITITDPDFITDRGFTGHEHFDMFGLINMNGRVYDPVASRFLSPDSFVQSPELALNYNGYVYCLNNPLIYTDPSGEFIFTALLPGIGVFIDAACWGAVLGGAGYTASVGFSEGGFSNWDWGQFGKSVGIGAVSGVVTAGIGSAFGAVGSNGIMGEVARAYTHGFANGMISEFTGGDFMIGFAAGGLGSLGGSTFSTIGRNFAQSALGQVSFSALAGGVGAELTGGDFWRGAATGATVGLLNHVHHIQQSNQQSRLQVKAVRAFLQDLGYSSDQVAQDVVMQRDNIFSKYYARLNNFSTYESSFTGGQYDSYSGTKDAYLSVAREVTIGKFLGITFTDSYAAKYYPSRAHSIGLVRTGIDHYIEAGLEYMDGKARYWTGQDNVIYDMHRTNALIYLRYR